ncbi:hypothetical protein ACH4NF_20970 [Streptomyces sp. NPDC017248]|uniref:hypothetical protein n=1 Tax=unclassified Streptomyces TaxID=2593676 RepID=UPI00378B9959
MTTRTTSTRGCTPTASPGPQATSGAPANSMGVTRATAQYRRDILVKKDPSEMEKWATGSS